MKTNKKKRALLITLLSVAAFVLFNVYDIFINPPAWWRFERQQDKKAILSYVEGNYPNATELGGKFPLQMPAGPFESSVMYFELDGIDFSISAQDGMVISDTYYEVKAEKYIRENYIESFMNERGLTPNIKISYISPSNHYGNLGKDVLGDIYSFEGTILVKITQDHVDGVSTPKEIVWFYEFYKYWMENCDFPNCAVYLYYPQNNEYATRGADYHIWFEREEKTFSSESDFYDHFTT